jgi:anthranilate synthase component 2
MKVLIIDNYDSFTYNLFQYIGELNGHPVVYRNDELTFKKIRILNPTHIILSPGPGTPENPHDFGICRNVILNLGQSIPLLGVCLGHQGIIHAFGGKIVPAAKIMHGKISLIKHNKQGIFKELPSPLEVMRYHSLMGTRDSFPSTLSITAETVDDHTIMGIKHQHYPIFGLQFHPESIGTPHGLKILNNFIRI